MARVRLTRAQREVLRMVARYENSIRPYEAPIDHKPTINLEDKGLIVRINNDLIRPYRLTDAGRAWLEGK